MGGAAGGARLEAPEVSVLMPAFDRERFIGEAIESVLAQTFRDFELVVVDDGSRDGTVRVVESHRDPRIRLERMGENRGIAAARNRALALARGRYVALLDSDDVAHPRRLEQQVRFLREHPRHALVGSWAQRIDEEGRRRAVRRFPCSSREVRARLLFGRCFTNTSVMARRDVLARFPYDETLPVGEDLDLWARILREWEGANLPRVLAFYREHPDRTTRQEPDEVVRVKARLAAAELERLGVEFTASDLRRHQQLRRVGRLDVDGEVLEWSRSWLERLRRANQRSHCYPEPEFGFVLGEHWRKLLLRRGALRVGHAWRSPLTALAWTGLLSRLRRSSAEAR